LAYLDDETANLPHELKRPLEAKVGNVACPVPYCVRKGARPFDTDLSNRKVDCEAVGWL